MTEAPLSLTELLDRRRTETPDRTAYVLVGDKEEIELSYGELWAASLAYAVRLRESNVRPGDRVVLGLDTSVEFIQALFACSAMGAIAVPCYPPSTQRRDGRLEQIIDDCDPAALIVPVAGAQSMLGGPSMVSAAEISVDPKVTFDVVPNDPDRLVALQYTSGSTRRPRGVMLNHRCIIANESLIAAVCEHDASSNFVGWAPLFHDMGLIANLLQPLYVGSVGVLMTPRQFLRRPRRWLQLIDRYGATTSGGPNFAFDYLADHLKPEDVDGIDLSRWRVAFNSAEPVRVETMQRCQALLEGTGFRPESWFPCYGLAEHTLLVSQRPARRPHRTARIPTSSTQRSNESSSLLGEQVVSCGPPAATVEAVVVDGDGVPVGDGVEGELWLAGPSVAAGYWQDAEETERVFGGQLQGSTSRFLRTGDRAFLSDGEMYLCGRSADLVIHRGENHHAEELEWAARQAITGRVGAIAAFSQSVRGREEVVVVAGVGRIDHNELGPLAKTIRAEITARTTVAIDRLFFVRASGVPTTPSGKVRRGACRDALADGSLAVIRSFRFAPAEGLPDAVLSNWPSSPGQRAAIVASAIRELVAMAAQIDPSMVDANRSLAVLGIDSVAAIQIQARIEAAFDIDLPPGVLLSDGALDSIVQLAVESDGPRPFEQNETDGGWQALSPAQLELYLDQLSNPNSPAYTFLRVFELRPEITPDRVRRILTDLADIHPELRTTLAVTRRGPLKRFAKGTLELPQRTFTDADDLQSWLDDLRRRPIDLSGPTLCEFHFVDATNMDAPSKLVIRAHHLVMDAWGAVLLLTGLCGSAEATSPTPLAPPTADQVEDDLRWWKEWAANARLLSDRDGDPSRSTPRHVRAKRIEHVVHGVAGALSDSARHYEVTRAEYLMALVGSSLCDMTGRSSFDFGCAVSGRNAANLGMIESAVRTIPVVATVKSADTFETFADRLVEGFRNAVSHSRIDPRTLTRLLRDAGLPAPQMLLAVQQFPPGTPDDVALAALGLATDIQERPGASLRRALLGDSGFASHGLVLQLAVVGDDLYVVAQIGEDYSDVPAMAFIDQVVDLVSADVKQSFGHEIVGAESRYQRSPVSAGGSRSLGERMIDQVVTNPDRVSIGFESGGLPTHLSYRALACATSAFADRLAASGVRTGDRVAVSLPRSDRSVIACLAAMSLGAAFVPVDPEGPEARNRSVLRQADARVVVRDERLHSPDEVVFDDLPTTSGPVRRWARLPKTGAAHLLFTSGSSGEPKGVVSTLGGLENRMGWMQSNYQAGPHSRIAHKTPTTFDVSVWELIWPLMVGSTMVVVDPDGQRDPELLSLTLKRWDVEICHFVPSMLTALRGLRSQQSERRVAPEFPTLQHIVFSGEGLKQPIADLARSLAPSARIWNLYGPTEASIDVSYYEVTDRGSKIPIGVPIDNVALPVVTPRLSSTPDGGVGHLAISGIALASGYLTPRATAEVFVPDPFGGIGGRLYLTGDIASCLPGGSLDYHGRSDRQVKVRGQRIEPAEIEAAVEQMEGVTHAAIRVDSEGSDELATLTLFVCPEEVAADETEFRRRLRVVLPAAFVPRYVVGLDRLPVSAHGKLVLPPAPSSTGVGPRRDVDELTDIDLVATVMADVLGRDVVGHSESFYDLGGDSLLAIQVVVGLQDRGRTVDVVDLMNHPRPIGLAPRLRNGPETPPPDQPAFSLLPPDVPRPSNAVVDGFPAGATDSALQFLSKHDRRSETYVTSLLLYGRVRKVAWAASLVALLERHPYLRSSFYQHDERWFQFVHERLAIPITFGDWSGEDEPTTTWTEFVHSERTLPIDTGTGPLIRLAVHELGEGRMSVTLSSFSLDGWCVAVILTELLLQVDAITAGTDHEPDTPAVGYASFVKAERAATTDKGSRHYWTRVVDRAEPTLLCDPSDGAHPGSSLQQRVESTLDDDLLERLEASASEVGTSLKTILLAIHVASIAEVTGRAAITTGLEVNGRPVVAGGDRVIGVFNNIVPFQASPGSVSWRELALAVAEEERTLWPHRRVPLDRIEAMGARRQRLFDTLFVFTSFHVYDDALRRTEFELIDALAPDQTFVPLTVHANRSVLHPGLRLIVDYDPIVASEQKARQLAAVFLTQARRLVADVDCPAVAPSPIKDVLGEAAGNRGLALFEHWPGLIAASPDGVAVSSETESMTYRQLAAEASSVLEQLGDPPPSGSRPTVTVVLNSGGERLSAMILGSVQSSRAPIVVEPERAVDTVQRLAPVADVTVLVSDELSAAPIRAVIDLAIRVVVVESEESNPAGSRRRSKLDLHGSLPAMLAQVYEAGLDGAVLGYGRAGLGQVVGAIRHVLGARRSLIPANRVTPIALVAMMAGLESGAGVEFATWSNTEELAAALVGRTPAVPVLSSSELIDLSTHAEWSTVRDGVFLVHGEPLYGTELEKIGLSPDQVWHSAGWPNAIGLPVTLDNPVESGHGWPMGRPIPGVWAWPTGDFGPLPEGRTGRLAVAGASIPQLVIGDPRRTAELLRPQPAGRGRAIEYGLSAVQSGERLVGVDGDLMTLHRPKTIGNAYRVAAATVRHPDVLQAVVLRLSLRSGGRPEILVRVANGRTDHLALRRWLADEVGAAAAGVSVTVSLDWPRDGWGSVDQLSVVIAARGLDVDRMIAGVTPAGGNR